MSAGPAASRHRSAGRTPEYLTPP